MAIGWRRPPPRREVVDRSPGPQTEGVLREPESVTEGRVESTATTLKVKMVAMA